MAASSGFRWSPGCAPLGDALGIVLPGPYGHRNGRQSRCIFSVADFLSWITVAKDHLMIDKNKAKLYYYSLLCIYVVRTLWQPADGNGCHFGYRFRRQASELWKNREASRIKLITLLFLRFSLNPPLPHRPCIVMGVSIRFMPLEGETAHHGGGVCVLCVGATVIRYEFLRTNPTGWEFFVPAGTDIAVKLLRPAGVQIIWLICFMLQLAT